jgi:hypothetical protein
MKYPKIFLVLLSCLFSLLTSCTKEENSEFTDTPIIESYLAAGNYLTVKVSRQVPFSSNVTYSSNDTNNLVIQVSSNNETHTLASLGGGHYIDSSIIVTEGAKYDLSFVFNSKTVSAYTYIPTKPLSFAQSATEISITKVDFSSGPPSGGGTFTQPDPIELTWDNPDNSYYLFIVENLESTLTAIRDFGDNAPPGNIFRKSPTNAASEQLRPNDFQYYGTHRIILFHVLPDYASLYNQNSTSSQNLTNPSTSIINGYGIFTGLNSDTLFVEVKEP